MSCSLPAYSIAMCTYNGAHFIEEQLVSIFQQTHLPKEIVICDDGSSDATLDIVRRLAEASPIAFNIIQNPHNLGFIKNFEQALGLCGEQYILLADQDDYWLADKAEKQIGYLLSHPDKALVFSNAYRTDQTLSPIQPDLWQCVHFSPTNQRRFVQHQALAVLLRHNIVTGATMALTREFVQQHLPLHHEYPHDAWLALQAAQQNKIGLISDKLIMYRQHANNTLGANYQSGSDKLRKALRGYWRSQFPPEFFLRLKAYQALLDSARCESPQRQLIRKVQAFQVFRLQLMQGRLALGGACKQMWYYWRLNFYRHYAAGYNSLIKDSVRLVFARTRNTKESES